MAWDRGHRPGSCPGSSPPLTAAAAAPAVAAPAIAALLLLLLLAGTENRICAQGTNMGTAVAGRGCLPATAVPMFFPLPQTSNARAHLSLNPGPPAHALLKCSYHDTWVLYCTCNPTAPPHTHTHTHTHKRPQPQQLTSCCSCSTQLASSGSVASSAGLSTLATPPPVLPLLPPAPPVRLRASASPVPAPAVAVEAPGGGRAPADSVVRVLGGRQHRDSGQ